MHPSAAAILPHFDYRHLPDDLKAVSSQFHDLAYVLVGHDPDWNGDRLALDGPELTVALRKLLEAKDAAVRAARYADTRQAG